jgi:hypothetical protein
MRTGPVPSKEDRAAAAKAEAARIAEESKQRYLAQQAEQEAADAAEAERRRIRKEQQDARRERFRLTPRSRKKR